MSHIIKEGESINSVAKKYDVNVKRYERQEIASKSVNNLKTGRPCKHGKEGFAA